MEPSQEGPPLSDLVAALEHATLIAKQTDPSQAPNICSSLQTLHHQLGLFLARFQSSPHPQVGENSVSSAEPMHIGDDELEEEKSISRVAMDKVEERMRNCVLQSKRRKRRLSPTSAAAVDQRPSLYDRGEAGFDPEGTRLRSLDLVFQFHG